MAASAFLRVLKGRWRIILVATVSTMIGGIVAMMVLPPRYEASARVTLDYLAPDPVSGVGVPWKRAEAYVESQIAMIRDVQVAGPAAESLGWLDDPDVVLAYGARDKEDTRDLASWVGSRIIGGTTAAPVEDSNIIEITYHGATPENSLAVVEAIRQAYVDANIAERRTSAAGRANGLANRAERLKVQLAQLEKMQADLQRQTGVVLDAAGVDVNNARLARLSGSAAVPIVGKGEQAPRGPSVMLDQVEAKLAKLAPFYGPQHPQVVELERQRDALRTQVSGGQDAAAREQSSIAAALRAEQAEMEGLKAKVLAEGDNVARVRLLQDEINGRRKDFSDTIAQMVKFRSLSETSSAGVTPIGAATVKPTPAFPNPALILGGTAMLGLAMGLLLAAFCELLGRRIRTAHSLEMAVRAPILGVLPAVDGKPIRPRAARKAARRRAGAPELDAAAV